MRSTTTAIHRAIPELPSAVFARLVDQLSTDDLRRFPSERIPAGLPSDFADDLPTGKRSVISDLMFEAEADRLRQRFGLVDRYGEPVIEALQSLETAAEPRGMAYCRQCLEQVEATATEARARAAALAALANALAEVYEQYSAIQTAVLRVQQVRIEPCDRPLFERAQARARAMLAPIDEIICRFYGLRLGFAAAEMRELRSRLAGQQAEIERLDLRIEALQESPQASSGLLGRALRLGQGGRRPDRDQALTELLQCKRMLQVPVDENRLTEWLDTLIESSLHQPSEQRWAQVLRQVRVQLLQLLNVYCTQQEDSAREAAAMPFAQVDAGRVIEFSLRSESFVLGYFARKRRQKVCWLSGAAEDRLQRIDGLQNDLLNALRRNLKR